MSYPGESSIIDYSASIGDVVSTADIPYITLTNLTLTGNTSGSCYSTGTFSPYPAGSGGGSTVVLAVGLVVQFTEMYGCGGPGGADSNVDGDGTTNLTFRYNVIHDPNTSGQHNVYFGANTLPTRGLNVYANMMYNVFTGAGFPNLQHNGRCFGCFWENSWLWNADGREAAFINGVNGSFIRANKVWNTGTTSSGWTGQAQNFYMASGSTVCMQSGSNSICGWDQIGNVIENNTMWIGINDVVTGSNTVGNQFGVTIQNDNTPADYSGGCITCGLTRNNFFRNNVLVGSGPVIAGGPDGYPSVVYSSLGVSTPTPSAILATDTWTNNIFGTQYFSNPAFPFGFAPPSPGNTGADAKTCAQMLAISLTSSGCSTAAPGFHDVNVSYATTPWLFNFVPDTGTAMAGTGTPVAIPTVDPAGNKFSLTAPNIGTFATTMGSLPGASHISTGATKTIGKTIHP